jgi:hypothetical protein
MCENERWTSFGIEYAINDWDNPFEYTISGCHGWQGKIYALGTLLS